MKNHFLYYPKSRFVLVILSAVLLLAFHAEGQSFQIIWGMNNTLSGSSTSSNFTAANAALSGAVPHQLGAYLTDGNGGQAYRTRNWPVSMSPSSCIEVSFSASAYEYDITSLSFRTKRSATGPQSIAVRSDFDNYGSSLYSYTIANSDQFYQVSVPLNFKNVSNTKFTFRIYGFASSGNRPDFGTLYFDEIIINGKVTTFILPVDLTYFTAAYDRKAVNLAWETSREENSKEFIVERSTNLIDFTGVGTVKAAGDKSTRTHYSFADKYALPGVSYYRLKMLDKDEAYRFSGVRDIAITSYSADFIVSPNPASAGLIRIHTPNSDPYMLMLYTRSGQNIGFDFVDFKDGYISIYPHRSLSSGVYILSLLQNGRKLHAKVLVP